MKHPLQPLLTDLHPLFPVHQHRAGSCRAPKKHLQVWRCHNLSGKSVILFYCSHSKCLFLTPHLNWPGSSLCLLPFHHLWEELSSVYPPQNTTVKKKTHRIYCTSSCRNYKYCTLKCIRVREDYEINSQNVPIVVK